MTFNKIISWFAVFLWMILIFNLSSQVAAQSNQLSTGITKVIAKTVEKVHPKADFNIRSFNHIVRKNAHFFAYLVLGVLVMNAMRKSGGYEYKYVVVALLICVLYAISDEIHQVFVPGRGPGVKDVLIDSWGATVGTLVYLGIDKVVKGRSKI
ncbi:VanZ family protein [Crassaminicella profunda]|uniref:VanZ family protein n=1 Tax=Crassaminicella profunda TaxID=1286698 RepID=UPI001CA72315|nr:VanZ family protein [Crassaminicella profunda]QZY55563.1 VanZ family protein [Crassaminicella profunda]